jgi:alpha-1,2-mannosyltransferase
LAAAHSPTLRVRVVGGIALAVAIVVVLYQIRGMLEIQVSPAGTDAAVYLSAARALRDGQNPYDQPYQTDLLPGEIFPRLPYLYPPLLAVLCIPLTYLPLTTGTNLFVLLAVIEAALLAWALSRWVGWPVALGMVFLFLQTYVTVFFAQIGFLIALLQFAALWAIQNGRPGLMGAVLSLGALLKITPAIGLLMAIRREYRQALLAAVMTAVVVVALAWPYSGLGSWLEGSLIALRVQWNVWWLASWTGILTYYLPSPYGLGLSAILGLTALAYTLLRLGKLPPVLGLGALLLLPILFARTTWGHHSVTALPVLAVLWQRSPGNRLLVSFAWLLMAVFDFRGVPPGITLCWVACVWPETVRLLDAPAERLRAWWMGLQVRWGLA